jgi:hypothetical protein
MISGSITRAVEKQMEVPVLVAKPEGAGCWKTKECQIPPRTQKAYAMEGNK